MLSGLVVSKHCLGAPPNVESAQHCHPSFAVLTVCDTELSVFSGKSNAMESQSRRYARLRHTRLRLCQRGVSIHGLGPASAS